MSFSGAAKSSMAPASPPMPPTSRSAATASSRSATWPSSAAERIIDVTGLVIAPGFIDVHTHDDLICITQPEMTPKISQGVTTLIVGNCGISAAPLRFRDSVREPFNLLGQLDDFAYDTFASYRQAIEAVSPRVNVAALVGHSTLRVRCVKDLDRPATASEREQMSVLLRQALDEGAVGMSSGVFYGPAQAADAQELSVLAETVSEAGGVYTAHLRDELEGIVDSLEEGFAVSKPRQTPFIVSHLKCAGVRNWGRAGETARSDRYSPRDATDPCRLLSLYRRLHRHPPRPGRWRSRDSDQLVHASSRSGRSHVEEHRRGMGHDPGQRPPNS